MTGLSPCSRADAVAGALIGGAVGDALGLPYEGLSPGRAERLLGPPDRYRLRSGKALVSDDTEHAVMTAQALLLTRMAPFPPGAVETCFEDSSRTEPDSPGTTIQVDSFARDLAQRLRWWLLGLPAGIGWATLQAIIRLWMGADPDKAGVYSAGNGPAMRSPVLGAGVADREVLRQLVRASTRLTHSDPRAEAGAMAVALAARHAAGCCGVPDAIGFLRELSWVLAPEAGDLLDLCRRAAFSAVQGEDTPAFAATQGWKRGISGFINQTVPVCLHAWLAHPRDFRAGVTAVIRCGGDADTTGAIAGGIIGAGVGPEGIPAEWRAGLTDWPYSGAWLTGLGQAAAGEGIPPLGPDIRSQPWLARLPRNLLFLLLVLGHGFRRLLPPY